MILILKDVRLSCTEAAAATPTGSTRKSNARGNAGTSEGRVCKTAPPNRGRISSGYYFQTSAVYRTTRDRVEAVSENGTTAQNKGNVRVSSTEAAKEMETGSVRRRNARTSVCTGKRSYPARTRRPYRKVK